MITAECIVHCFLFYLFIISSKVHTWGRIFKISFNKRVTRYIQQGKKLCTKQLYTWWFYGATRNASLKEFLREKKKHKRTESWLFKKHTIIYKKHKNFQLKCHISRDNRNSETKIKSLTAVRNGFKLIKLQVKIVSWERQNP